MPREAAISGDIDEMKSKDVDVLATCVDGAGSARLGQAFKDNGMDVVQFLPNGYDKSLISENAAGAVRESSAAVPSEGGSVRSRPENPESFSFSTPTAITRS